MLSGAQSVSFGLCLFLPSDLGNKVSLSFSKEGMLSWVFSPSTCAPLGRNSYIGTEKNLRALPIWCPFPMVFILAAAERAAFHTPGHSFDVFCRGHSMLRAYLLVPWLPFPMGHMHLSVCRRHVVIKVASALLQCLPRASRVPMPCRTFHIGDFGWVWARKSTWRELSNKTLSIANRAYTVFL